MATVLPLPSAIKLKEVNKFDGSPADLSLFDTQIRNSLECLDIPAYYGGCVQGSAAEGYDYVPSATAGSVSNYRLGRKLCAAISKKFTEAAAQWWDDYDTKLENPKPNCWKPASAATHVPEGVVEVSLFTLLTTQFDPTVDAQQAELELAKYRWNPLDKGALGVIPFRGHVNRLCTRAGKSSWAIKGIAIRNTFPDWLRSRVMLSKSEDHFWDDVAACVNTYMADRLHTNANGVEPRSDKRRNGTGNNNGSKGTNGSTKSCQFCGYNGHEFSECRKMKAAQQQLPSRRQRDSSTAASSTATASQTSSQQHNQPSNQQSAQQTQQNSRSNVICYNCRRPGHISTNCPEPRRTPAQGAARPAVPATITDTPDAPLYLSAPASSYAKPVMHSAPEVMKLTQREHVDEQDVIDVQHHRLQLPLYQVLSATEKRPEVFTFSPPTIPPAASATPSSILHSYTKSPGGQNMLTIWDTAALLSLVPMSTVRALNLEFTPGADVSFVVANGSKMSPVGHSFVQFSFPESNQMFREKVYVVDFAPFQLLLGIRFLHRHWAAILLPWAQIVLLRPTRLELQGSVDRPSVTADLLPDAADDLRLVEVADESDDSPGASDYEVLVTVPMHMEIGKRCLLSELDGPAASDFQASAPDFQASATVTRSFVKDTFHFGPSCPPAVVDAAVDLILSHWDQFSWHEMDLGCIQDVPYLTTYLDGSPCVCKSRRHNYAPRNNGLIEAKSRPLIDMGVYRLADSSVVDRAQLVVIRSKADEPDNPKYARIAHDFRCKNDKAVLLPVPMATREEMYAFLPRFKVFWKTDADRGFLQIVQAPEAVQHTGFEMFGQLWVSERMLFGQINGPAFFELNFNVMAHKLKFLDRSVKNFFDDVIGGASHWNELLLSFAELLDCAKSHGWKFKPAKTYIGWESIEAVGMLYGEGTLQVTAKSRAAVAALRPPRTITEVRAVLGLFNQFRDRIPGYALRVQALTSLTRQKRGSSSTTAAVPGSRNVSLSVEAAGEFAAIKDFLVSPAVLVVFQADRKTFVYSDASLGSSDADAGLPVGFGGVITQVDPSDSMEYVCAFASAGLTPAMRNYPTVRLEALAFIFVLSKFYDWLKGIEFTWRTDAKAHKYIMDNKHSPNPVLNRYFIGLQAFRFHVEWVPGLRMIADAFSRMVVVNDGETVLDTRSAYSDLVFGPSSVLASVLYTWSLSDFPPEMGPQEPCFTFVSTTIPAADLGSLELSALEPQPPPPLSVDFPPTFVEPCYSAKDRAKLHALAHLRGFFLDGSSPPELRSWVKWLAKRLTFDGVTIWKTTGSLQLKVLESPEEILPVLRELHDGFGHRGLAAVLHHFRLRYWIPAAAKVIRQYISGCTACQKLAAPLKFEVPGYQVQPSDVVSHWSVDCVGPFPADPRTGDLHVIIAVDWLSRWAEAKAINSTDAATCSDFLYSEVCCRYGVPESLRSDHGSGFDNEVMEHLASTLKMAHHLSTPYYPQSNGMVERIVQTFKSSLKRSIQDQIAGSDGEAAEPSPYWAHLVPSMLFAYRATPHSALGVSPAELVFGRSLRLPGDHVFPPISPSVDHKSAVLQRLKFLMDVVPALRAQPAPPDVSSRIPKFIYEVGDKVWVRDSKYDVGFPPVFAPRWKGPFFVKERLDKNAYRLRTIPEVSGKRSIALALPISGSRLRLANDQELSVLVEKLRQKALRDSVDVASPVSFVLPAFTN